MSGVVLSTSSGSNGVHGRITAVLGPTNTGKTYLAIERMLAHRSGMIGFPLRLLARENYDKIVRIKGKHAVALVTGEEKILPPNPSYWVCTVESMPLDRHVAFLAVDEIQLCADQDRGHIFTDRLLHARGGEETMFLGSETIRPLIQKLVPRCEFVTRPRFSTLTYAGPKKLTRLPPRSAIVAFSATDVYALAELMRRQRGGTAVVLGALSPRTRNAQVELYQAGEVDYLVATDAIGMGLNMDVDHVAFARLTKFDGQSPRRLKATEIAQIAGRAGRHMTNGTFGTTDEAGTLEPELVQAVEEHRFENLKALIWRNPDLDFRSPQTLIRTLDWWPDKPELIRVREADDQLALTALMQDQDILKLANGRAAVQLLWDVCQVPDFRKVLSDAHVRLLGQVYKFLRGPEERLPKDWVARQVSRLDRTDGDIDALVTRIAHIRTWTYVSHRPQWLADPLHWQEVTRTVEDKLSDALHDRLTQRFIDRRAAHFARSLKSGKDLLGAVSNGGEVLVEGHSVGRIDGFRFTLDADAQDEDARALMSASRRALRDEVAARVRLLEESGDETIALGDDGILSWNVAPVARLAKGSSTLTPDVQPLHDDLLEPDQRERVRQRLMQWLQNRITTALAPLFRLKQAELSGTARGIAFQVGEALGGLLRHEVEPLVKALTKEDRHILSRAGVRIGGTHIYMPALLKPRAVEMRALLWSVRHGYPLPARTPPAGRVSISADKDVPDAFMAAIGYPHIGQRAIRADMLDRAECDLHKLARDKKASVTRTGLAQILGCTLDELDVIVKALGFKRIETPEGVPTYVLNRQQHRHKMRPRTDKPRRVEPNSPFNKLKELVFTE